MGTTLNYSIPYAETSDPPHGPNQQQALAEATDSALDSLDGRLTARAIGVKLTSSTNQTIAAGTDTLVDFSSSAFAANGVTVNSGLTVVTIDEDGLYFLAAGTRWSSKVGENSLVISTGTADVAQGVYTQDGTAGALDNSCSTFHPLLVGDQVSAVVFSDNGNDLAPGAGRVSSLAVFKVGNL